MGRPTPRRTARQQVIVRNTTRMRNDVRQRAQREWKKPTVERVLEGPGFRIYVVELSSQTGFTGTAGVATNAYQGMGTLWDQMAATVHNGAQADLQGGLNRYNAVTALLREMATRVSGPVQLYAGLIPSEIGQHFAIEFISTSEELTRAMCTSAGLIFFRADDLSKTLEAMRNALAHDAERMRQEIGNARGYCAIPGGRVAPAVPMSISAGR